MRQTLTHDVMLGSFRSHEQGLLVPAMAVADRFITVSASRQMLGQAWGCLSHGTEESGKPPLAKRRSDMLQAIWDQLQNTIGTWT
jgi:hypothetical protein